MAPAYPRLVTRTSAVINILMHLLVAKCIMDRTSCDIDGLPAALRDFPCDLAFSDAKAKSRGWTCGHALQHMSDRFASWPSSPFVMAAVPILRASRKDAFYNCFILSLMGTAGFAAALRDADAISGSSMRDKAQAVLGHSRAHAASFVCPLHKSGKILRDTLAKLNKAKAKSALLRKLDKNPKLVQVKIKRAWVPKALIMRRLLSQPGMGPYTATVFWRLYRAVVQYPCREDNKFCLTGPGSRAGINWLRGFPPAMAKTSTDKLVSLFYADHICRLSSFIERNSFLKASRTDPAILKEAKGLIRTHSATPEGKADFCCELSKFINTVLTVNLA